MSDTSSRPTTRSNSPSKKLSDSPIKSPKKRGKTPGTKERPPWSNAPSRPTTKDTSRSNFGSRLNTAASKRSTASDETIEGQDEKQGYEEPPSTIQQPKRTLRKLTKPEIEHEAKMCSLFERKIADLKLDLTDKKVIFDKLMAELFRMLGVFDRLEKLHETKGNEIVEAETAIASSGLSHSQRKELMEKGPFNLVFHGIKPDWIEEEMDDDPEFKRDVLEQKIRSIIRDQCELQRDVGIIDVYRHKEGAPLRGAFPVVVQFKARREKEHVMWRAKEKLRDSDLVVTEDSQSRLLDLMKIEAQKIRKAEEEKRNPKSPKKVPLAPNSPKKVPNSPRKFVPPSSPKKSPTKLSTVANAAFAMSSVRPAHLDRGKRQNIRSNNSTVSNKTKYISKMSQKSGLTSDEEDSEDEDEFEDQFDDEIELDDMLEDFPKIERKPKEKPVLPDSPQKSLFEDFMF